MQPALKEDENTHPTQCIQSINAAEVFTVFSGGCGLQSSCRVPKHVGDSAKTVATVAANRKAILSNNNMLFLKLFTLVFLVDEN